RSPSRPGCLGISSSVRVDQSGWERHISPTHRIRFIHEGAFDEPLVPGDAVRWTGPGVWRVEDVDGERVTLALWPADEPYPPSIRECGPGEWPDSKDGR